MAKRENILLDKTDRKLLNLIQKQLPLKPRPYKTIAETLGLREADVISRIAILKEKGIIRRIGGIFDSGKLGFITTLVALEVEEAMLDSVAQAVSLYPGVTHNYERNHLYNLWFALITESRQAQEKVISEIGALPGVKKILNLPAVKNYKLRVNFDLTEGGINENN
jgi:siroheme decarboxylase